MALGTAASLAFAAAAALGPLGPCDTAENTPTGTCEANIPGPGYGITEAIGILHPSGGAGARCGYAGGVYGPVRYCIRYTDELKVVC